MESQNENSSQDEFQPESFKLILNILYYFSLIIAVLPYLLDTVLSSIEVTDPIDMSILEPSLYFAGFIAFLAGHLYFYPKIDHTREDFTVHALLAIVIGVVDPVLTVMIISILQLFVVSGTVPLLPNLAVLLFFLGVGYRVIDTVNRELDEYLKVQLEQEII